MFCLVLVFVFALRQSSGSPGWPQTHHLAKDDLALRILPRTQCLRSRRAPSPSVCDARDWTHTLPTEPHAQLRPSVSPGSKVKHRVTSLTVGTQLGRSRFVPRLMSVQSHDTSYFWLVPTALALTSTGTSSFTPYPRVYVMWPRLNSYLGGSER